MFEVFKDENGKTVEAGNILYANLILMDQISFFIILMLKEVLDIMIGMEKV